MDIKLLILFIILNAINVVLQTIKSLATVKCGKVMAALVNAVAYGLYTVVLVYTVCDLPLIWKVAVVAGCNFVGVFVVKWVEELATKDKLWKVEATIPTKYKDAILLDLKEIPKTYIENIGHYTIFNFFCATQKESQKVKIIIEQYGAKYFVSESKNL